MTMTQLFREELEREAGRTRRALEQVSPALDEWAPHPKSMPLGRLAGLIATMPSWFAHVINQEELDIAPPGGAQQFQQPPTTELLSVLNKSVADGIAALAGTTDEFLLTTRWKLLAGGHVVMEQLRHIVLRDTINHLAHHRGQLTVYLRLKDVKVPAIYGPSADDQSFA